MWIEFGSVWIWRWLWIALVLNMDCTLWWTEHGDGLDVDWTSFRSGEFWCGDMKWSGTRPESPVVNVSVARSSTSQGKTYHFTHHQAQVLTFPPDSGLDGENFGLDNAAVWKWLLD